MTTATILSCYIAKFEAFVATKNKKAVKLGCPEIKFEISAPSEFIGEVGQKKVRMEVQCTNIVTLDGNYGTSWMFIFKAGSNVIKYVSSAFDCSVGDNMVIEATIKDHAVYNSKKQTVITRAKKIA
jgi:hypothetical protein